MTKLFAIVGMGDGMGLAIARRFAQEGFAIAMIARNAAKLERFQATLQAEGFEAHAFAADAGEEASLQSAFTSIQAQLGSPEVMVYNVATPKMEKILNETMDTLAIDFKINVAGALAATKAVLPAMQAQRQGTILFTGGGFAMYPSSDFGSLSLGKAGIRSLAKMLAEALKPDGIHVGTITICGTVNPEDPQYSPGQIAEQYWAFHTNPDSDSEIVY
ncbi:MAG: SDR family NAD(P)-dependent oxidoreductase [Drouetiella hepatica Uher 2000/2452]|uniref:SDR family NAD(P)-dependent oxidoreductase n=1 Tax=Drouetiella hepatica Uher 2000/2452 TaxID=904376 RepID=A0A951UMP4_9CYAN|nr:SDR family NAD(P)-dependent oxidoreductase [Drouetiella hepatica Uher 2000/2452]